MSLLHLAFLSDDFGRGVSLRAAGLSPNPASTRNSLARGGLEQMDSLDVVLVTWAVLKLNSSPSSYVVFSFC